MKKWLSTMLFVFLYQLAEAQGNCELIEETSIKGLLSGTITYGYIFKIGTRDFYVVNERTRQSVRTLNPSVKISQCGFDYKLEIQDLEEPVICKKLKDVIETQIDGDFNGWQGETIFKMRNGQIWQQSSYAHTYRHAYNPDVLIYEYKGSWMMRVEEVDEPIEVKKLGNGIGETHILTDEAIETQISGEFTGWDGDTIFKMSNGQVWQQASYAYMYHYAYRPSVIIYKSGSTWQMKVKDIDKTIEVRKIN